MILAPVWAMAVLVELVEQAALVEMAHDVQAAAVLGLLARRERLLALDLQQHLDALKGRRDERHGDGAEESCAADLRHAVLVVLDGAEGRDELLAEVIAPERDGECCREGPVSAVFLGMKEDAFLVFCSLTHGRDAYQRRGYTCVKTLWIAH